MEIYICPHCERTIESLDYSVDTEEQGTAYLNTRDFDNNRRIYIDNHEYDNNSWTTDPKYSCPYCDNPIELERIIIEKISFKDTEKKEKEKEEEDAIESEIRILTHKTNKEIEFQNTPEGAPFNIEKLDISICPHCKHIFSTICYPKNNWNHMNRFTACPNCNESIDINENLENRKNEYEQR
jgi:ribosomal protein L37AE/L43A